MIGEIDQEISRIVMRNFIFHDTETSGLSKMFGQIFQFAAILSDENCQILDQFEIRSGRMPDIVPDPGALLVTASLVMEIGS